MPQTTTVPPAVHITRWCDPIVDTRGHVAECPYVERFWLPVLGPSATLLARRLAVFLGDIPEGFTIPTAELSRQLGLGVSPSRHAPLPRAIDRCVRFGVAKRLGPDRLAFRRVFGLLPQHQVDRLTPFLRHAHAAEAQRVCQLPVDRDSG